MEIIQSEYNNISIRQLNSELTQKLGELHKIDAQSTQSTPLKQDYFDISNQNNYDQEDFGRVLSKFKAMDAKIKNHEQTHATLGQTTAPISYNYQQGPDGKLYVVGGSVRLDTSIPNDPKAALNKLDQIQKAASGVDDQSSADLAISTQASLNKMLILSKLGEF